METPSRKVPLNWSLDTDQWREGGEEKAALARKHLRNSTPRFGICCPPISAGLLLFFWQVRKRSIKKFQCDSRACTALQQVVKLRLE